MPIALELPLDLPEVRVLVNRMLEDGTLLIEVESTLQTAQCHRCGREIDRFHGSDRVIRLRHLPVFGRAVLIEIRRSATAVRTVAAGRPHLSAVPGMIPTARLRKRSRHGYSTCGSAHHGNAVFRKSGAKQPIYQCVT